MKSTDVHFVLLMAWDVLSLYLDGVCFKGDVRRVVANLRIVVIDLDGGGLVLQIALQVILSFTIQSVGIESPQEIIIKS